MNHGIPTLYKNIRFRSRLEAKWAVFFDRVGWSWTYEPFDLAGYIPDFVLHFYKPLLVEVKPEVSIDALEQHVSKIESSGWNNEAIVVGAAPLESRNWAHRALGLLHEREEVSDDAAPNGFDIQGWWDTAVFFQCRECRRYSLFHTTGCFRCRVSGCYDGDHHILPADNDIDRIWAEASNFVQWRGGQEPR